MTTEVVLSLDDVAAAQRGTAARLRWGLLVGVVLVVVSLAVVNVKLHADVNAEQQRKAARTEALGVATQATQELLSYDYRTIDRDLPRAVAWTTGPFTTELQTLEDKVVKPTAVSKRVITQTTVSDVAVVRSTRDTVDLLVFANQVTVSKGAQTQRNSSRLSVSMKKVDGKWLVTALQPI